MIGTFSDNLGVDDFFKKLAIRLQYHPAAVMLILWF